MMQEGPLLAYGETEIAWLKSRDRRLAAVIDARGMVLRRVQPEPFAALMRAVIGQQISGKAQDTIWERFKNAFSPLTPEKIAGVDEESMRACGVSLRKAQYLRGIAREFAQGEMSGIDPTRLGDAELRDKLLKLRGIGPWTVEMLLIFTFQRKNILSFGDLAIQRGMRILYGHKEITPAIFARHFKRYSPYATVAGIYLWEVAGGAVEIPQKRGKG